MDLTTFGNSTCALNLIKILEEDGNPVVQKSISRYLVSNNKIIKELAKIEDEQVRLSLTGMYRKEIINSKLKVPNKVLTHAKNILIGRLRDSVLKK